MDDFNHTYCSATYVESVKKTFIDNFLILLLNRAEGQQKVSRRLLMITPPLGGRDVFSSVQLMLDLYEEQVYHISTSPMLEF